MNDFKIGMTLKQVKATKLYRSQIHGSLSSDGDVSFHGGKWTFPGYKGTKWITENCKGEIKQLHPITVGNFKIGDLEFRDMDLAFLHDTLVAVYFYPDKQKETILKHYKEKYGNGNGSYYHYRLDNEPCKDRDMLRVDEKETEKHKWENERVALEYYNTSSFYLAPNEKIRSYDNHYYLVYDKKRYPVFEDMWKGWEKKYEEHVKNSNESSLNSL